MIGTDILRVSRLRRAAKNERFLSRVFTAGELAYYAEKGKRAETLAGMFCAKEAALKALGCGLGGAALTDIEVAHETGGAPALVMHGHAAELLGSRRAHLTISHDGDYAIACVLLERI